MRSRGRCWSRKRGKDREVWCHALREEKIGKIELVVIDVAIVAIVAIGETRVIIVAIAALSQLSGQRSLA